jgi:hypothetical protein
MRRKLNLGLTVLLTATSLMTSCSPLKNLESPADAPALGEISEETITKRKEPERKFGQYMPKDGNSTLQIYKLDFFENSPREKYDIIAIPSRTFPPDTNLQDRETLMRYRFVNTHIFAQDYIINEIQNGSLLPEIQAFLPLNRIENILPMNEEQSNARKPSELSKAFDQYKTTNQISPTQARSWLDFMKGPYFKQNQYNKK